jgi:long-chain acyl-CoA synthetase
VQARAGVVLTQAQVIDHLRPRVAAFKLPVHVDIRRNELPRTASGKIIKTRLREELLSQQ